MKHFRLVDVWRHYCPLSVLDNLWGILLYCCWHFLLFHPMALWSVCDVDSVATTKWIRGKATTMVMRGMAMAWAMRVRKLWPFSPDFKISFVTFGRMHSAPFSCCRYCCCCGIIELLHAADDGCCVVRWNDKVCRAINVYLCRSPTAIRSNVHNATKHTKRMCIVCLCIRFRLHYKLT